MTVKKVNSICPYCGVGCGIIIDVAENKAIKVSGDPAHPSNAGRLCTKGGSCTDILNHPQRLAHAHVRPERSQPLVPVNMPDALAETARRLLQIIADHGPNAVSFYISGQMSLEAQYLANKLAKGFIGTNFIESNSRLCMASAGSGYKLSLGADAPPGSYDDFDHADLFFVIGSNMADCHPILFLRMMDRVKAGAKLIVVDPRRTLTAEKADLFLQINPGTDLALLNGLLQLLHVQQHIDEAFIKEFTEGWQAMPDFLADYAPENVAELTGLSVDDIVLAAQWIGQAEAWMSCWTMGLNQSTHGTWNTNAVCNLHLATGKICSLGSGPFSLTGQPNAMGGREMGYMGPGLPGQRSITEAEDRLFIETLWGIPAGKLPQSGGSGTIAMFEDMRQGKIKACWIICTNPVASVPNRHNVIAALQAADFVVVQDVFLDTETNAYADIVLPGALWAEAEGTMVNSERNVTLMQQAVQPPGDALADWQIIVQVACAMGYGAAFDYQDAAEIFEEIKQVNNPKTGYDMRGISYDKLRAASMQWPCAADTDTKRNPIRYLNDGRSQMLKSNPDGTQPRLTFATPSGKARFWPRPHVAPAELPGEAFNVVLNTGRLQHQWHTMTKTGKISTLNKLNPGPFVEIHPEDARRFAVKPGQKLQIRSLRGKAVLPTTITDRVKPGQCFVPFHWNDVFGTDLAINAVTSDAVDPVSFEPECKFTAVALQPVAESLHVPSSLDTPVQEAAFILNQSVFKRLPALEPFAILLGLDTMPEIVLTEAERFYVTGFLTALAEKTQRHNVPMLPTDAPISAANSAFINGMLAGAFADKPSVSPQDTVTVLWASTTGNSEQFAAVCAAGLTAAGLQVNVRDMGEFKVSDLPRTHYLLALASTFGDGDPPYHAEPFWQALQTASDMPLQGLHFSVLAFGDSKYAQFCGFGRLLDERLAALGAVRILPRSECEPDYADTAAAWLDAAISAITGGNSSLSQSAKPSYAVPPVAAGQNKSHPVASRLLLNKRLSGADSNKETRQFALDLSASRLPYEAGDALGIWPRNCPKLINELLATVKLPADKLVTVKHLGDMPLFQALSEHYDIIRVTPELLQAQQISTHSDMLDTLLRDDNRQGLSAWLEQRHLLDVLQAFPVKFAAEEWLTCLKSMQPRYYSISSSPKMHPDQVHLTVATVRYALNGKHRGGVCSTFLADRAADENIPIFLQKNAHFRLPAHPDCDVIMIGPGTGIAPFRGFLQERQATGAAGRNWLFFGEQRADSDFYYRDELVEWQNNGLLYRLDTAFSRDQAEKIYVQQRMLEQGKQIWDWLENGAYLYVCGDAGRMAKDVDATFQRIIETHAHLSSESARAYLSELAQHKRYQRDVY